MSSNVNLKIDFDLYFKNFKQEKLKMKYFQHIYLLEEKINILARTFQTTTLILFTFDNN